MIIHKHYRLDIHIWETKMLFNGCRYFFQYDLFPNISFMKRKKFRGGKLLKKSIPVKPSIKTKEETDLWLEYRINQYKSK